MDDITCTKTLGIMVVTVCYSTYIYMYIRSCRTYIINLPYESGIIAIGLGRLPLPTLESPIAGNGDGF